MFKTNLIHNSTMAPSKKAELIAIYHAFEIKFQQIATHVNILGAAEAHPDWHIKRFQGHRWEVRTGVKDNTYYGTTLTEALCRALLEIP